MIKSPRVDKEGYDCKDEEYRNNTRMNVVMLKYYQCVDDVSGCDCRRRRWRWRHHWRHHRRVLMINTFVLQWLLLLDDVLFFVFVSHSLFFVVVVFSFFWPCFGVDFISLFIHWAMKTKQKEDSNVCFFCLFVLGFVIFSVPKSFQQKFGFSFLVTCSNENDNFVFQILWF